MSKRKRIKVRNKEILGLANKIVGYREGIRALSEDLGITTRLFWKRIREVYGIDVKKEVWKFDHNANTLVRMDVETDEDG